ncbi:hypothetical protein V2A60_009267 [Cordyceps javanica]
MANSSHCVAETPIETKTRLHVRVSITKKVSYFETWQKKIKLMPFSATQELTEMIYPQMYDSDHPRVWKIGLRLIFWLFVVLQAAALVFIVLCMTGAETSRPEGTRFELYKNSRFEACAARPVQNLDCAALFDTMKHHPDSKGDDSPGNHTTLIYGFNRTHWCDNAWCFRDFKVVPSAIPSRVLLHGRLLQWWFIGETALFTAYHFKSQAFFDAHTPSQCKDKGIGMKLSLFLSLASLAWWWTDFGLILAQGSLPISFTTLSMFSRAVTWRTAHSFHLHPLRCAFHAWRRVGRLSKTVLLGFYLFRVIISALSKKWQLLPGLRQYARPQRSVDFRLDIYEWFMSD